MLSLKQEIGLQRQISVSLLIHEINFVHTFKQSIQAGNQANISLFQDLKAGNQDNISLFQDLKEFVMLVLVFAKQITHAWLTVTRQDLH